MSARRLIAVAASVLVLAACGGSDWRDELVREQWDKQPADVRARLCERREHELQTGEGDPYPSRLDRQCEGD